MRDTEHKVRYVVTFAVGIGELSAPGNVVTPRPTRHGMDTRLVRWPRAAFKLGAALVERSK